VGAFFLLDDPLYLIFAKNEPPTWAELSDFASVSVISFPVRYMASRQVGGFRGGGSAGF